MPKSLLEALQLYFSSVLLRKTYANYFIKLSDSNADRCVLENIPGFSIDFVYCLLYKLNKQAAPVR